MSGSTSEEAGQQAAAAADEAPAQRAAAAAAADKRTPAAKECAAFEPQAGRRNLCKICLRTRSQHAGTGSPRSSRTSASKLLSTSSPSGSRRTTPESKRKDFKEEDAGRGFSRESISRSRSASKESLRSCGSGRAAHRPATAGGGGMDEKYMEDLESDLFEMEDKYEALCRDKTQLNAQLDERLGDIEDLEQEVESCRVKVSTLEKRVPQLELEIKSYRERLKLPESEQGNADSSDAEFESRARELEDLCQELMEENDQLKEEVEEVQKELSEMHDSFQDKEGQANSVRELQRELDAANKSYRVVQFKLRKAERRFDQCEAERGELEEKFRRLGERILSGDENIQIQELEDELRMAKEVSVRLHDELEFIEDKRTRLEADNQKLKLELASSEREKILLENDIDRVRLELDKVKTDAGISDSGPLQVVDKTSPRPRLGQVASREPSVEEDHLKRELTATKERETDLVEQLRFSKEEVKILRRKLQEAEEENDSLTSKLHKLLGGGGEGGHRIRFASDESADIDLDELPGTAQLESEAASLRGKVVDLDRVNQGLRSSITALETRLEQTGAAPHLSPSDKHLLFKYSTEEAQSLLSELDADMEEIKRKIVSAAQLSPEDFALQEKWIEASEARKQLDLKVTELRRRVSGLEEANADLRLDVTRLDSSQRQRTPQKKTVQELEVASKAELIREVGDLEDEVEDLLLVIKKSEFKSESLEYRMKTLDEDLHESRRQISAVSRVKEICLEINSLNSIKGGRRPISVENRINEDLRLTNDQSKIKVGRRQINGRTSIRGGRLIA